MTPTALVMIDHSATAPDKKTNHSHGAKWKPLHTTVNVLLHLSCHWLVAGVVVLAMKGFEVVLAKLYPENAKFFDIIPIAYIFHATDLGVLGVVGFFSIVAIVSAMRE